MARLRKQPAEPGDNSGDKSVDWGNIVPERLRSIVQRIERLEEERKDLAGDIKDIYAEAKSAGFDAAVIRALIRERARDPAEAETREALLDVYRRALGDFGTSPLGAAALAAVA